MQFSPGLPSDGSQGHTQAASLPGRIIMAQEACAPMEVAQGAEDTQEEGQEASRRSDLACAVRVA